MKAVPYSIVCDVGGGRGSGGSGVGGFMVVVGVIVGVEC